jgi:LacI family transcriptional regulator
MKKKNIRIKDIAKLAGVSTGTVDRVLHNRGRVSEDALHKVMEVMKGIDYKPNVIARTLGSSKTYRIAVLVPDPSVDPYWAQSMSGISQAESEWSKYGVVIEPFLFNQYDKASFEAAAASVIKVNPAGVLVAPLFYREALPFFNLYKESNIPFVLFNTRIAEAEPICFIGQELYRSGRVAAELVSMGQPYPCSFAVLHIHEDIPNSPHLMEKERGFREYFADLKKPGFEIKTLNLGDPDDPGFEAQCNPLFNGKNLRGIFVSTSRAYAIAKLLQQKGTKGIRLVGYDLLEANMQYLKSGQLNFIINQNPKRQAFLGINHLASTLVFKTNAPKNDLLPLEVITRENLLSYLNSHIH